MYIMEKWGTESSWCLPNRFTRPTGLLSRLFLINSLLIPTIPGPNGLWRILLNGNSKQNKKIKKNSYGGNSSE